MFFTFFSKSSHFLCSARSCILAQSATSACSMYAVLFSNRAFIAFLASEFGLLGMCAMSSKKAGRRVITLSKSFDSQRLVRIVTMLGALFKTEIRWYLSLFSIVSIPGIRFSMCFSASFLIYSRPLLT